MRFGDPARKSQVVIPPEYRGDPIQLTASITGLQPGVQGAGTNVRALVNPTKQLVEIFGFKFRLRSTLAVAGHVIACRLDLGDFALTNGFIPVFSFGKAINLAAEQPNAGLFTVGVTLPPQFYAEYTVNLSRPILLPPGAAIRPQFQHRGQTTAAIDVHMTVFGRKLPLNAEIPQKISLPYWAAYTGKSFTLGTVDADQSSESDLYNPFDVPLRMERFIGRVGFQAASSAFSSAAVTGEWEGSQWLQLSSAGPSQTLADSLGQITCSITDSLGAPIVKKLTPFRLVFDAFSRSWPINHELPSGAYYNVVLANGAWTVGDPTAAIGAVLAQPIVSMLGWREVQ